MEKKKEITMITMIMAHFLNAFNMILLNIF